MQTLESQNLQQLFQFECSVRTIDEKKNYQMKIRPIKSTERIRALFTNQLFTVYANASGVMVQKT